MQTSMMRIQIIATLWATASAIVLPNQLSLAGENELEGWLGESGRDLSGALQDELETAPFAIEHLLEDGFGHEIHGEFDYLTDDKGDHDDLTIYQIIKKSPYTTKFVGLIDEHEDLVKLLNSTDSNLTLFVPPDAVFEHAPHDKKPDAKFLKRLLSYHVADGHYTAHDLVTTNTLPTIIDEDWLGGKPQRLRASLGLGGININFFVKVIKSVKATNGAIHAVNHVLVPPTMVGRELTYFPAHFSTLLYAYEKTDFVKFIHNVPMKGSTVFAPTNRAFTKLGVRANAFLFNTEKGLRYLKALLKYQIVANVTLYTDTMYKEGDDDAQPDMTGKVRHYDLPTLLHEKFLAVDVKFFGPFTSMWVNKHVPVVARDAVAKNGVIQVVGRVPLPPHKHHDGEASYHGDETGEEGEITVEELIDRLEGYVEEDEQTEWAGEL